VKPGEIVAGTVAHVNDDLIIVDISTVKGSINGYLSFTHLSDNLGRNNLCLEFCRFRCLFFVFIEYSVTVY